MSSFILAFISPGLMTLCLHYPNPLRTFQTLAPSSHQNLLSCFLPRRLDYVEAPHYLHIQHMPGNLLLRKETDSMEVYDNNEFESLREINARIKEDIEATIESQLKLYETLYGKYFEWNFFPFHQFNHLDSSS